MARFFLGVTLFTLLALCIACGGVPATSTTSSGIQGPRNSTAVDRDNAEASDEESQLEHDTEAANQAAEDDRQDSLPYDPTVEAVKQWIRDGEPGMGNPSVGKIGQIGSMEIIQVIDDSTGLVELGKDGLLVMIHGWDLSNAVDGQYIKLGLCQVVGTQQYVNGFGTTNTVFVMQPLDDGSARADIFREAQEEAARRAAEIAQQKEDLRESQYRTWKSADGQFAIEARLDNFALGTATLERRDGTTVEVPNDKLSDDDQLYIKEEFDRRAKAARELRRMER